jgi:hypothetical protein
LRLGGVRGTLLTVSEPWTPRLALHNRPDRCRLTLVGVTYGDGSTMQEAANDLLVRLHDLAVGIRRGGLRAPSEARPDPRVVRFLWEIGELTARGGSLRDRVFGDPGVRL